jgi:hypothetical protein
MQGRPFYPSDFNHGKVGSILITKTGEEEKAIEKIGKTKQTFFSAPRRVRTFDPRIKNPLLCLTELLAHPCLFLYARGDSNTRPADSKSDALSI